MFGFDDSLFEETSSFLKCIAGIAKQKTKINLYFILESRCIQNSILQSKYKH